MACERRRARSEGVHPGRARRQARRLAAGARSVPARDQRAGRPRRGRRPRALDQACRERGRRGLDGGVADPRVPGGGNRVSLAEKPVTVADLRRVDLFDELDDEALSQWAAAAEWRSAEPGEIVLEQGERPEGMLCLLEGTLQTFIRDGERFEPVAHQLAPTWIGAIATLSEEPIGARMVAVAPARVALIPG